MENLTRKLSDIGLSEKEAKVYVALLQTGRGTAYKISKLAGVKTPTTYLVLEELRQKGLVLKIPHSKSQIFFAKTPEEYVEEQKNKILSFEEMLPTIAQLAVQKDESTVITFDGYDGIVNALHYKFESMNGKTILALYSHLPDPDQKIINIYLEWNKKARKSDVRHRVIAPDTKESDIFIKPQEEIYKGHTKLINIDLWSPDTSTEIIPGEFVRIISSKDLQAIIIDNKRVAKSMEQIFEMIWNSGLGKDYK
ncbi:MAG: hypothetical protein HYT93_02580 [Parcubacteria group bacterium]|nr:hypothetical protein [Parcubacteria group bacterium]